MTLIIGNYPYKNINFDNILNNFKENVRCNYFNINTNNGNKGGEISCCIFIFEDLKKTFDFKTNERKQSFDCFFKKYKKTGEYIEEQFKVFYAIFNAPLFHKIYDIRTLLTVESANEYLKKIKCPFMCTCFPRVGFLTIIYKLVNNETPIISHFTITNNEKRISAFTFTRASEHLDNTGCHKGSKTNELNIMRWLHKNKHIDLTLCMLEDNKIPILNCDGLIPSDFIVGELKKEFKDLIIKT